VAIYFGVGNEIGRISLEEFDDLVELSGGRHRPGIFG